MDRSAPEIVFTPTGCNFCDGAERALWDIKHEAYKLPELVEQIKKAGEGKKFDCLVGMSGGLTVQRYYIMP